MTDQAEQDVTRSQPAAARRPRSATRPVRRSGSDGGTEKSRMSSVRSTASARTKPVRRSVDLSPAIHAQLTEWCAETAAQIGTTRVTGQAVLRALVARLLVDEGLSRRIRADLSIDI